MSAGYGLPAQTRSLQLDHDFVARAERVIDVVELEFYFGRLAGNERFGDFEAVAKFAAHDIAADELLIASHTNAGRIGVGTGRGGRVGVGRFPGRRR